MVPPMCQTSGAAATTLVLAVVQGMAMSIGTEECMHRAMVGKLTQDTSVGGRWSALGSVTTISLSSHKVAWIWLVKVLGGDSNTSGSNGSSKLQHS